MERCWNSESLLGIPTSNSESVCRTGRVIHSGFDIQNSTVLKILSIFVIAKSFSYPNFFSAIRKTKQ